MQEFLEIFDMSNLHVMIIWLAITYSLVLAAMLVDLISGVRKAIAMGIARTSTGYKKTCTKANKYFSPMVRLTFIDLLVSAITAVPVFSMLWAAWCLWCEWKSVTEKALTKQELRNAENTMNVIIQNKADLAQVLVAALQGMSAEQRDSLINHNSHEYNEEATAGNNAECGE